MNDEWELDYMNSTDPRPGPHDGCGDDPPGHAGGEADLEETDLASADAEAMDLLAFDVGQRLGTLFGDESGIRSKTYAGVTKRLSTTSATTTIGELIGVAPLTIGILFNKKPTSADRNDEGR